MPVFKFLPDPPTLPLAISPEAGSEIARRWLPAPKFGRVIGYWENVVCDVFQDDRRFILRLTPKTARSVAQLLAEADFVDELSKYGMPVSIFLNDGCSRVGCCSWNGIDYYSMMTLAAAGRRPTASDIDDTLLFAWGATFGRMHRVAEDRSFASSPPLVRPMWKNDPAVLIPKEIEGILGDQFVCWWTSLLSTLKLKPSPPAAFGLIHADLHGRNFHLHDGTISVFDFDDCQYHWYAYDVAVAAGWLAPLDSILREAVITQFLKGYSQQRSIPEGFLADINFFITFRAGIDYIQTCYRTIGFAHLDELHHRLEFLKAQLSGQVKVGD